MAVVTTAEARILGTFKDNFSGASKRAFQKFKKSATRALKIVAVAAAAAFAALTAGIIKFVGAANKEELAIRKLEGALRSTGQFTREYSAELQKLASDLQDVTAFGNETILTVIQQLAAFGASRDTITALTKATLDLAAGMGVDLKAAALLMGKAVAGEFGTLSRYGILVDANASKSEKLAQTIEQVNRKFGGQARIAAEAAGGRLQQISNVLGDVFERLGEIITKSEEYKVVLGILVDALKKTEHWLIRNRKALEKDFLAGIEKAVRGLALFADAADAVVIGAKKLEIAAAFIASGINNLISIGLQAASRQLKLFIFNVIVGINEMMGDVNKILGTGFGKIAQPDLSFMDAIIAAGPASTQRLMELREEYQALLRQFAEESSGDKIRNFMNTIVEEAGKAREALENVPAGATAPAGPPAIPSIPEKDAAFFEQLENRLDFIKDFVASQEELELQSHFRRLNELEVFFDEGLILEDERRALQLDLTQKHENAMAEIRERGLKVLDLAFQTPEGDPEKDAAFFEQLERRLGFMRDFVASQEELELQSHLRRLDQLQTFFDERLILEDDRRALELDLEQIHQDALTAIRRDAADEAARMQLILQSQAIRAGQDVLSRIGQFNKSLFDEMQVASSALALINAYLAASQVLADPTVPFLAKFAAAAAVLAHGIALASSIKSLGQSSGGGGTGGGGSSAQGGASAAPQPSGPTFILPDFDDDDLVRGSAVRNLFKQVNKHLDKGGRIILAG